MSNEQVEPAESPVDLTLLEAAEELADLMDDVVTGNYKPDSFTTQPIRNAIKAVARERKAVK